jgi:hypothetical protein
LLTVTGSQPDAANSWGGYMSMAVDVQDRYTFWCTAEYYMATASFNWWLAHSSNLIHAPDFDTLNWPLLII